MTQIRNQKLTAAKLTLILLIVCQFRVMSQLDLSQSLITLDVDDRPFTEVLGTISDTGGVSFSYNPKRYRKMN